MKISQTSPKATSGVNSPAGVGPPGAAASQLPVKPAPPPDQVQISSLASYLFAAVNGSPAHVAKLAELSADVSLGRYQPDTFAVSGSIIQHSIEFGAGSYFALSVAPAR
jgi:hypothetical protein